MHNRGLLVYFFLIVSPFIYTIGCGQNPGAIDSMRAQIQGKTDLKELAKNYNILSDLFSPINADSASFYAKKGLTTAQKSNARATEAESYFMLGYYCDRAGRVDDAIEAMENARDIYTELGDSAYLVGCYNNLGVFYSYGPQLKKSLEYFIKAKNLAETLKDTFSLPEAYWNIGTFYEYFNEYGPALNYYQKALEIEKSQGTDGAVALTCITIANVNLKLQRFDEARENIFEARQLLAHVDDHYRKTELYINLAVYFLGTNQLDSAKTYIDLSYQSNEQLDFDRLDADIWAMEGDWFLKNKNYNKCLARYDEAIALYEKQKTSEGLGVIYNNKASALFGLGRHQEAYQMLQMEKQLAQKMNLSEVAKLLGEFEYAEATKEAMGKARLEEELRNQKNKTEIAEMRSRLRLAIFSVIFMAVLAALLVYFYIEKRKRNRLLDENVATIKKQKALLEENLAKLENNEKKLAELNATKDRFFSIIAHDLKNPFNVLIGMSDMIRNNPGIRQSGDFEPIIDGMFQTATSAYNLLENLLEWALAQTGEIKTTPKRFAISEVFASNILFFQEMAKAKKIEIALLDALEAEVFADYNMVNFVVRNLLNNALKFSFPESKIEISSQESDGFYVFSIKDYGTGMSPKLAGQLFTIQYTKPKAGTANEKGTGLGLVLSKEFIEKNGGKIWCESEVGKGSIFSFSLPQSKK